MASVGPNPRIFVGKHELIDAPLVGDGAAGDEGPAAPAFIRRLRRARPGAPAPHELAAAARWVYAERRRRDRAFGHLADVFRDPAWDMMLDLFAMAIERRAISVSSAARAACIPMSTALRCMDQLIARGLMTRIPDQIDRRRSLIELTPLGFELLEEFLSTLVSVADAENGGRN